MGVRQLTWRSIDQRGEFLFNKLSVFFLRNQGLTKPRLGFDQKKRAEHLLKGEQIKFYLPPPFFRLFCVRFEFVCFFVPFCWFTF